MIDALCEHPKIKSMLTAFGSGDADAAWWCCKVLLWKLLVHRVNPHGLDLRFLRWSKKGNERRSGMQHISFLHIMIKCDVLYQSDQSVASKPFNMLRPTSQMDKHWMQMDWHRGGGFIVMHLFDRIFDIWQLNCDQTRVLWGSLYSGIVHGRLLLDVLMLLFGCLWPGDPTCQKGETNNCFCLIDLWHLITEPWPNQSSLGQSL